MIATTTGAKGLSATCRLGWRKYPVGRKVSDKEFATVNLKPQAFHGEWNYQIFQRQLTCKFYLLTNTKLLSDFIEQQLGILLEVRQCKSLFRQLNLRLRKPRPLIAMADLIPQLAFKKNR